MRFEGNINASKGETNDKALRLSLLALDNYYKSIKSCFMEKIKSIFLKKTSVCLFFLEKRRCSLIVDRLGPWSGQHHRRRNM